METGTKISLGLHGVMLGLAVFGGPLFDSDESEALQISEVSIITSAEFDSMMSSAPSPQVSEPSVMTAVDAPEPEDLPEVDPVVEAPTPEPEPVPEQPVAEPETPELPQVSEPAEPEVVVESPEVAETPQEATGSAVVVPDAQVSDQDVSGQVDPERLAVLRPRLRPAPRISNEVNEKPATDAQTSTETSETTQADDTATEQAEAKEETAPQESTTEIVTEVEQDPNSAAPVKSARPKGRPSDLVAKAKAAAEAKEAAAKAKADKDEADRVAAAKAAKEADAKAIEAALKAATQEASKPSGPPMTGRETEALIFAVTQCWNPPTGVVNAGDLKVTLLIDLDEKGALRGTPKLISPSGTPQGLVKQAFEAGKRALIRCAPYNGLPKNKYEHWRQIEVVFNPKNMAVK